MYVCTLISIVDWIMTNHGIGHGINSFRVEFRGRIGLLVMIEYAGDSCHQRGPGFESQRDQSWSGSNTAFLCQCILQIKCMYVCMYVAYVPACI